MQKGFAPIFIILGILALGGIFFGAYFFYNQQKVRSVTDFESCSKLYPVMTSYPAQCNTPDGRHFVQELSEEEKKKLIPPQPIVSLDSVMDEAELKAYTNATYKYKVDYPRNYFVKSHFDEYVYITDDNAEIVALGTDYNLINVEPQSDSWFSEEEKKMSGYDYMIYRALMLCAADGPQGSIHCDETSKVIPFNNKYGQKVYEIYLKSTEERFSRDSQTVVTEKVVGPLFGIEMISSGDHDIRLVFIYEQNESLFPVEENWDFSVSRGLANSFRLH